MASPTKQITVKVSGTLAVQAEQYADGNMSAYAARALQEKVVRDAADAYRQLLATNPEFAREAAAAREFADRNARAARAEAWSAEAAE